MTIIARPLQRCSRSEMEKVETKTEDFSDYFNEIQVSSDYCDLRDLDLNPEHFTEMHDFNDVNINQLLTKSEPTESVIPPSRRASLKTGFDVTTAFCDETKPSGFQVTSKVLGETNQVLSGSSYWDFLNKPNFSSYTLERPPSTKYSPVQYATCYPATTVHSEPASWSSPKPASPESLLPAFSNFNCNVSSMEQSGYTPSGLCQESNEHYAFHPASQGHVGQQQVIPEPPAYSYQPLSASPPMPSADSRLMAPSSEPSWVSPQMPPLHPMGFHQGYSDSNYSSPTGSISELQTLGCQNSSTNMGLSMSHTLNKPSNSIPLSTAASTSRSMVSHPSYLSQSFPGASPVHPVNRTSRNASGGAGAVNPCSMPFAPQPISCQSSPLSQGSPGAPTGCHGSWSDIPMTYQSYVTNGAASSVASDLDIDNFYTGEERTSPVGESLPGDILLPDDGMLSPARTVGDGISRRGSRTGIRRMRSRSGSHSPKSMELWQFLWVLLAEQSGGGAVVWLDKPRGVFKVVNQVKLCELWSDAKRRNPERTKVTRYSNLTRTLRYYYQRGLMKKGERDHVYQFIAAKIDNWVQARARSATH